MFRFIVRKIYTPDVQVILPPLATIIVVAAGILLLINGGYKSITSQIGLLRSTKSTEDVLENKLETLKQLNPGVLDATSEVVVALPKENPGVQLISQMKKATKDTPIIIKKVELKNENKFSETVKKMELNGQIEFSDYDDVILMLKTIAASSPLSTLDKFESESTEQGILKGELKTTVYWSELPTLLPPLTEPVLVLSQEDQELLTNISNLIKPEFDVIPPTSPIDRANPFN